MDAEDQRRLDAVRTDLAYDPGQSIQLNRVKRLRLTVVGDTQNQAATLRVGECRQLVGEIVATRGVDPPPPELHFLQFESRVLTETHLLPKSWSINWHGSHLALISPSRL